LAQPRFEVSASDFVALKLYTTHPFSLQPIICRFSWRLKPTIQ